MKCLRYLGITYGEYITAIELSCQNSDNTTAEELRADIYRVLGHPHHLKSNLSRDEMMAIKQLKIKSYYLKSGILRQYKFKRFECCDPKNRKCKHSLDSKGNIKRHIWFVSMGAVIENLINLNISTSYFLVTHIVVLLSL